MKINFAKKTIFCFLFLLFGYVIKAQTVINQEVVNSEIVPLNVIKQGLNENTTNAETVSENLDLVKTAIPKAIIDEGTNDPTTSGMILMYADGKAIYTKVQKTGATTLSIIYVPKQN